MFSNLQVLNGNNGDLCNPFMHTLRLTGQKNLKNLDSELSNDDKLYLRGILEYGLTHLTLNKNNLNIEHISNSYTQDTDTVWTFEICIYIVYCSW